MIVNVEFFDENPIDNVITNLNYRVDKTIFFGYKDALEASNKRIEKFLKDVCGVKQVEFCPVDEMNLTTVLNDISFKVQAELEEGHQVFFDLTGGETLPLVAFGMLSKEFQAPMHRYDVCKNEMIEYGYEGCPHFSEVASYDPILLDLDSYIALYGGTINYRMHKDFKETYSEEDCRDIEELWKLSRAYHSKWVYYSALFRKFVPDTNLRVSVDEKLVLAEAKKTQAIGSLATFQRFLDECEAAGFLKDVSYNNGKYHYTYKNHMIQSYFWDGGSILEMHTFLEESKENVSDDCRVGVHIDWDGVIHGMSGKDVLNEIDILSIKNNLPTFISCKIGHVDQRALYELETVANRFGGKYAKKVLAVAKNVEVTHLLRAKEMRIEVRKEG